MFRPTLGLVACISLSTTALASEFDELVGKLPSGANVLLSIDSDRVLASQMAMQNNWGSRVDDGSRPVYLPQEADKVLVAAQVDPVRGFDRAWEVAIMGLKETLPMRLVARAEGGYTDTIHGLNAAWVPSDAYFLEVTPEIMGLMYPANRQAVSRWAERQQNGTASGVSPFLLASVEAAKAGPQIVLAIDLQDAAQPHRLQQTLSESDVVTKEKQNINSLVDVLASLKGLVLKVTLTDKAKADVQIDFGKPVSFSESIAKQLTLGALTRLQAELPGVDKWKFSVSGSSIMCSGDLSAEALRRILSIVEIPSTKFSSLKGQSTEEASEDDMVKNSLVYFQTVTKMIEDLKKNSGSYSGDSRWFDRYADKIDRLPILHVDPELLDFGQNTAQTLRVMSGARKDANLRSGVRQTNMMASSGSGYDNYNYSYGGSGYTSNTRADVRSTITSANAAKTQEIAGASATKIEGFRLIDNATLEIRRTMTERYNKEF